MRQPAMPEPKKSSGIAWVLLAWALVALPLGWGLFRSVRNALPLFNATSAPAAHPRS
jgi:hypothetical protein